MNLALFIRGLFPGRIGGQEIYGYMILKNFIKLNHKIALFCSGSFKIYDKQVTLFSYRPMNTAILQFVYKVLWYLLIFIKYRKKLKIQLIHANGVISEGMAAVLIKKILKIPVVITLHGGGIYKFAEKFPFIVKYILNHSDRVIAINNYIKKLAKRYTSKKIYVIPNFIDSKIFTRASQAEIIKFKEKCKLNDKIILLIVARLVPKKGISYLIHAIRQLAEKYPNICLMIIGNGPQKKYFEKLVNSLDLKELILFLGRISNKNLAIYYSICDIFVLPSLFEGQPTVILEAMACEAPIIGTKTGGIPELIKSGYNGLIIPKKNLSALIEGIDTLLSNPDLRETMRKNSRKIIEEKYDSTKNFRKIYELYLSAMKSFYNER